MSNGDPIAFAQKIFEESYNQAKERKQALHGEVVRKKVIAFALKGVAVFGGIAVTAGLSEQIAHFVGIAISVAVATDYMLMNHLKLVTRAKADNAYKHLLRDTANAHSDQLGSILRLKKTDPETASTQLEALLTTLKKKLDEESKKIDEAVDDMDVKALNAYSMESDRQAQQRHA